MISSLGLSPMMFLTCSVALLAASLAWTLARFLKRPAPLTWPCVEGEVIQSEIRDGGRGPEGVRKYEAHVAYRYEVGGRQYSSTRTTQRKLPPMTLLRQFPRGSRVQVYHDPANPQEALLEPPVETKRLPWLTLGLVALLASALCLAAGSGLIA